MADDSENFERTESKNSYKAHKPS